MSKAAELAKWGEVSTNGQVSGRRNIIINGAMNVAQRSASVTDIGAAQGYFCTDRFKSTLVATAARYTVSQDTDAPAGFSKALKYDVTTADTSVAAGELHAISYRAEGQDISHFEWGTSDAEQCTFSFYAKATSAQTVVVNFVRSTSGTSRSVSKAFSITTSYQRFTFTLPTDTGGSAQVETNAEGLAIHIGFGAGSTYAGGTINETWEDITNNKRFAGVGNLASSTDNNFFITGVQMEVGSVATPFEHRSFGEELALCQRYFQKSYQTGVTLGTVTAEGEIRYIGNSGYGEAAPVVQFKTTMRVSPTKTFYSPTSGTSGKARNHSTAADVTHSASNTSSDTSYSGSNYGAPDGNVMGYQYALDSEL